jgi:hypothetical protein
MTGRVPVIHDFDICIRTIGSTIRTVMTGFDPAIVATPVGQSLESTRSRHQGSLHHCLCSAAYLAT